MGSHYYTDEVGTMTGESHKMQIDSKWVLANGWRGLSAANPQETSDWALTSFAASHRMWIMGLLLHTLSGLLTVCLVLSISGTSAGGPWSSFNPFKSRVEHDPNKNYLIADENGPWMILATTFAGEEAEQEARALVMQLRKEFDMSAYLHRKRFDFSDTMAGLRVNRFGDRRKMRYRQNVVFDEWAVLVGDFASIDLPEVERKLKKIKSIKPSSLNLDDTKTQRFRGLRKYYKKLSNNPEKRGKGPMGSAFVTRNPLLPKEFFAPSGIDKFVYNLNKDWEHSLVHCKGHYTVRVATFQGNVVIDQRKIDEIDRGKESMKSRLAAAAAKANKLTKAMRATGIEAYQFHDRNESIVTVGNFESGGTHIDAMQRVIGEFRPEEIRMSDGTARVQPKVYAGIPCDMEPFPIEVPRYSVGSDYAQAGLFR